MRATKLMVGDHSFDIKHLLATNISFRQPAKNGMPERIHFVEVDYGEHAYSRYNEGLSTGSGMKDRSGNSRIFDIDRYYASFDLPGLIKDLMNTRIYRAGGDSYMIRKPIRLNGYDVDYEVYFEVWAFKGSLRLRVKTAYTRDLGHQSNRPNYKEKISFSVIIDKALKVKNAK